MLNIKQLNLLTTLLFPTLLFFSTLSYASNLTETINSIEKQISGHIGVAVLNTQTNQLWSYNGDQAFPMMSTFKTLACAKLLADNDKKIIDKSAQITINKQQLIPWSPITEKLIGKNISLNEACEATMLMSDNTAANVILQHTGGPKALTLFMRELGDNSTRLDRFEPQLNQAEKNDLRDTTTPKAMVYTLNNLLLEDTLEQKSKSQLIEWMKNNKVSNPLLRSILPQSWSIADRSGAGGNGSRGITAMVWNKQHKPLIISIYLTQTQLNMEQRNQAIVEVGEAIFKKYSVI